MIVSKTMKINGNKPRNIHYICLKIGDQVYSTTFGDLSQKDIPTAFEGISTTTNIGAELCLWLKGLFTETNNHQKINPTPFELHVYSDIKDNDKIKFNPFEWKEDSCEVCGGHLYCEKCKKYSWRKNLK